MRKPRLGGGFAKARLCSLPMDTLTHALSGALLARLMAVRIDSASVLPDLLTAGKTAPGRWTAPWDGRPGAPRLWQCVVVGAVAGAFPDIDVVARAFGDTAYLTQHRGITHSLLMLPLWAAALAWLLSKCFSGTREQAGAWKSLLALTAGGIAIHIVGDWITQFGTMLLQPLSNQRFGLGAMFIIDLVFSGLLLVGLLLAALLPRRRWPALMGLGAAAVWVGVAWTGQQEAIAVAQRHALVSGVPAPQIVVMPRPASPFNWTVTVFDGRSYHVAHINTRRTQALDPRLRVWWLPAFVRDYSAPYQPASQAAWQTVPRFGGPGAPDWVAQAWGHEAFGFYRWFAQTPALLEAGETPNADGMAQRCVVFRDLRFDFPGRDEGPFRYGLCLPAGGVPLQLFKLEGGVRRPV